MEKFNYKWMLCIILIIFLVSCNPTSPEVVQTQLVEEYPYPLSGQAEPSDYISPTNETYPMQQEAVTSSQEVPQKIEMPAPKPVKGVVVGTLLTSEDKPYMAPVIYLGQAIKPDQENFPPLISLSEQNDLKGAQDITGYFVFDDVPPGIYGLIIWSPVSQLVIQDPADTTQFLYVNVEAGKVTDLGVIVMP